MSKRGSKSAKFIGGADWKNGSKGNNLKSHLKAVKKRSEQKILDEQFNEVILEFGFQPKEPYCSLTPFRTSLNS